MKALTIAGNLGKDAEVRSTQDGTKVAGFTVAVESREGREKTTLWFDCSLWGKRGETLAQYLTKGTKICVSGDLGTREYNGKTYLTVKAQDVTLMGGGQRDTGGAQYREHDAPSDGAGAGGRPSNDPIDQDAIPF